MYNDITNSIYCSSSFGESNKMKTYSRNYNYLELIVYGELVMQLLVL